MDTNATESLVHACITSKLDINKCLLSGLPDSLLHKLQHLQNASACLVSRLAKCYHTTTSLRNLQLISVKQHISFKTMLMFFKVHNNLTPEYIQDLLERKMNTVCCLCYNKQNQLWCQDHASLHMVTGIPSVLLHSCGTAFQQSLETVKKLKPLKYF